MPKAVAARLFSMPVPSHSGRGIGLYHAAKQAGTTSTEPFTFKILNEKTELKDSVVGVQLSQGGQSETLYIVLVRELGAWRVSLDQSNTMNN